MEQMITIQELEAAINRRLCQLPPGGGLTPALQLLATLYGQMIYGRLQVMAWDQLAPAVRAVLGEAGAGK